MLGYGIVCIIVLYYVIKKLVLEYSYPTLRMLKYIVEIKYIKLLVIITNNWYDYYYQLIYIIIKNKIIYYYYIILQNFIIFYCSTSF